MCVRRSISYIFLGHGPLNLQQGDTNRASEELVVRRR